MFKESTRHGRHSDHEIPDDTDAYAFLRTPDGVRLRYGCWPERGPVRRGSIVVLGGRSEFIEKYCETIDELCQRGFRTFSLDWRGQGLSQRMLPDSEKSHIDDYKVYVRDMAYFLEQVVYPQSSGDILVLAHSMGAHITVRFMAECPHRIGRAVFSGPMIDIQTQPAPPFLVRWFSRFMVRHGYAHASVILSKRHNPWTANFSNNRLTRDRQRFLRNEAMVKNNPALASGQVTYGWLAATFESIDLLKQPSFCKDIDIPILITMAGKEYIVNNRAIRRLSSRLPNSRMVLFKESRHEMLQELDSVRSQFWRAFDEFIEA